MPELEIGSDDPDDAVFDYVELHPDRRLSIADLSTIARHGVLGVDEAIRLSRVYGPSIIPH